MSHFILAFPQEGEEVVGEKEEGLSLETRFPSGCLRPWHVGPHMPFSRPLGRRAQTCIGWRRLSHDGGKEARGLGCGNKGSPHC